MKKITKTQQAVLDYIRLCKSCGFTPTRREIAQRMGWASNNAAQSMLERLENNGVISMPAVGRIIINV